MSTPRFTLGKPNERDEGKVLSVDISIPDGYRFELIEVDVPGEATLHVRRVEETVGDDG